MVIPFPEIWSTGGRIRSGGRGQVQFCLRCTSGTMQLQSKLEFEGKLGHIDGNLIYRTLGIHCGRKELGGLVGQSL